MTNWLLKHSNRTLNDSINYGWLKCHNSIHTVLKLTFCLYLIYNYIKDSGLRII